MPDPRRKPGPAVRGEGSRARAQAKSVLIYFASPATRAALNLLAAQDQITRSQMVGNLIYLEARRRGADFAAKANVDEVCILDDEGNIVFLDGPAVDDAQATQAGEGGIIPE